MFDSANETHFYFDIENLANNKLQVLAFDGIEALNTEYVFEITLVSNHIRYDITKLLGKKACLSFTSDKKAGVHGVIVAVKRGAIGKDYSLFKVILSSRFMNLHHRFNQRAFINQSVPEIVCALLNEHGLQQGIDFSLMFKEDYPKREFCCQYKESDADFIYRLCEEEGINIYYQHANDSHLMVLSDANSFFGQYDEVFEYRPSTGNVADSPVFKSFSIGLTATTTKASFRNYNFQNMKIPEGIAEGTQSDKANHAIEPKLEFYDYPQRHLNVARGEHYAKIEIERLKASQILAEAYTDVPLLKSGYCFSLSNYPELDALDSSDYWLVNQVYHQGRQPQVLEALGSEVAAVIKDVHYLFKYYNHPVDDGLQFPFDDFQQGYRNCLISTPKDVPCRPQRLHPKPQVLGSQTAVVTGGQGEEIFCDEFGRVKVLFHWDRLNPKNEHSSCWIRVASNWAHDGYGAVVIPRVGMEVKVDFLEGDIDQPIISGAIHNGINKLPYELPANKTKSVFKTSSSKGGVGSNEFRIEDKKDKEQIFVQAQKDYDQLTKNNHTIQVNNNSHLQVNNEHSETIVKNRYTKIEGEEHHLTDLDRRSQVLANDYTQVGLAEHKTVGTITTTEAGQEIHLKSGGQIVIDGGLSLTLKAGGQHIVLNPAGIWMTMPVWTGGVPMAGSLAIPQTPLFKQDAVTAVTAPAVVLKPFEKIYSKKTNSLIDKPTYNLRFQLTDDHDHPYSNTSYIAYMPDGSSRRGRTDKDGYTETFYDDQPQPEIKIHALLDEDTGA
ncbi:type VI secretion system tip protein VgrG [Entomomonas moraniae]|uniref:Type VI secretion system tip protein VgrG n=1 Tax=Entomomonas moraniae TaxID=2213226 RepID=A0A3S9XE35_9GAMM|nr:type VI secretion system tip protein TssI/VgrG [Entomomonas moraniae]AZS50506.1 type VI secretion system tip protein VgrG [Entomomonas moraniae]